MTEDTEDRFRRKGPGRRPGRTDDRHRRRRGPRERGRSHGRRREGHPRDRQLHGPPRPRAHLPAPHPGAARRAPPPPHGQREHGPLPDGLHRFHRRQGGRDDRHLGPRPGPDHPGRGRPGHEAGRPGPPGPRLPAAGRRRRGPVPGGTDRGRRRPGPPGRPDAGRRHLRGHERGRLHGPQAPARGDQPALRHPHPDHRRAHPLPHAPRDARPQARGDGPADLARPLPDPRLRGHDPAAITTSPWSRATSAAASRPSSGPTRSA